MPDGDYTLLVIYLENADLDSTLYPDTASLLAANRLEGSVTLSGGQLSGSLGTETVSGRLNGSGLVMQITDDPTSPTSFTNVSGQVGLLGSVAGTYYNLDLSQPGTVSRTDGLFVAALVPVAGLQPAAVAQTVARLYGGELHTLFQDVFGSDHDTGYGTIQFTGLDPLANQVTMSGNGFTVNFVSGVSAGTSDTVQLLQGTFLQTGDGRPTGLLVLEMLDSTGDKAFFILPLGNRRGIYVAVDTDRRNSVDASAQDQAYAIGHAFLSAAGPVVPQLKAATSYGIQAYGFASHIASEIFNPDYSPGMWSFSLSCDVPANAGVHSWDASAGINGYFLPGVVAFSSLGDYTLRSTSSLMFEVYEGGGLIGQLSVGGCFDSDTRDWADCDATHVLPAHLHPGLILARAREVGSTLPDIVPKTFDYLERPVYAYNEDMTRLSALRQGTFKVDGTGSGQATLVMDGGSSSLDVEQTNGIMHAVGTQNSDRLDIYWITGVPRGLYLRSQPAKLGAYIILEAGEVFLSD
ncbi:hypothetical protein EDC39_11016 [Geothermobacter ehrlichii]|uniref:Uncharacterized protein n=1 Tax=Geothermobacter ehrlichii TaxID=213224 RepID=A0A5D3WHZ3_9BACT|nr:hypothetical protein [Geothermobacter ehrlichii]TYO97476.1 hypothetical protein EDC39_11016 [Geothermobacter ehrlichii]